MSIQLTEGVQLHLLPTDKYKTIRITLKFKAALKKETITQRTMIANLLEISSKRYPTQTAFRSELSELFGASFGTAVSRKGNQHILTVSLNIVNEKYLTMGNGITEKAVQFLEEVLFHPNVEEQHFDQTTFKREKEKLRDDYDGLYDDKQTYASLALQALLFEDSSQKVPSIGTAEDLEKITSSSLYQYYQSMIQNDEVDIYVMGDVEQDEIVAYFKNFSFDARQIAPRSPFYQTTSTSELREKTEEQEVTQAKLNLGYTTSVFYHGEDYYAGQVFNGLFGGFPHSKLFMNVREKESLAYYAASSLDTFRGVMVVQTGIDGKESEKVKAIVAEQLYDMQAGDFTETAFLQTKNMLKNQLIQSEDNPGSVIERIYANQLALGKTVSLQEWIDGIEMVTREQVIEVAKKVKLKGIFFLSGGVK